MCLAKRLSCLLLAGCLLPLGCRAKPAPDSQFLAQPKLMSAARNVPYNRIWINPKYRDKRYTELYVDEVNTDYLMAESIWEMAALVNLDPAAVKINDRRMGAYLRDAFVRAARKDLSRRFTLVSKPGPHTLVLQMAIVQLVPSKGLLQAAGYATWVPQAIMFVVPFVTNSEDQGKGVIAFEARTRDGATGDVTMMFADRECPPFSLVDVKALFWWESAKPICDAWARQFVEMQTKPGGKIDDVPTFQLLIW
jgi:hypothetical protein